MKTGPQTQRRGTCSAASSLVLSRNPEPPSQTWCSGICLGNNPLRRSLKTATTPILLTHLHFVEGSVGTARADSEASGV